MEIEKLKQQAEAGREHQNAAVAAKEQAASMRRRATEAQHANDRLREQLEV
jgi:hypothetical protein